MKPDEIKRAREALGISQVDLAARIGVTTAAVESWEQGRRRPSPEAAAKLLHLLRLRKALKEAR